MCGISGHFGKQKIKENLIHRTLNLMKERGPDSQNFWQHNNNNSHITLLVVELNIIIHIIIPILWLEMDQIFTM